MNRVVAVLAALGLIVGAIFVRRSLDGNGDGDGQVTDGKPTTMHVVCAEELRTACEALGFGPRFDIDIEDAAVTADKLQQEGASDVLDIWAVPHPWPDIIDDARTRAGLTPLFADASTVVGSSRLVAVGDPSLDGCDWKCLGERGAGGLRLGSRPLATSGLGVLTVGAAAAGWFGGPSFATNDFDPAFDRWLAGFVGATEETANPVTQLLQSRAFFDVALSFEAEAGPALENASPDRTEGLALLRPAPAASLDAVVVTAPNGLASESDDLAASLQQALAAAGWSHSPTGPNGLPSPGVLIALRDRVSR